MWRAGAWLQHLSPSSKTTQEVAAASSRKISPGRWEYLRYLVQRQLQGPSSYTSLSSVNKRSLYLGVLLQLPGKVKQRLFYLDKMCKKTRKERGGGRQGVVCIAGCAAGARAPCRGRGKAGSVWGKRAENSLEKLAVDLDRRVPGKPKAGSVFRLLTRSRGKLGAGVVMVPAGDTDGPPGHGTVAVGGGEPGDTCYLQGCVRARGPQLRLSRDALAVLPAGRANQHTRGGMAWLPWE